jgi:uncharacterized membrane protein (UPF0127 family)
MRKGFVLLNNKYKLEVLLALSEEEQIQGLMKINPPLPNMAFIYKNPKYSSFWMKDTKAPLDIVFCLDGKISKICKGEPFSTTLIDGGLSDLVVEFPYGTCKDYGLIEGSEINLHKFPSETAEISNNLLSTFSSLFNL